MIQSSLSHRGPGSPLNKPNFIKPSKHVSDPLQSIPPSISNRIQRSPRLPHFKCCNNLNHETLFTPNDLYSLLTSKYLFDILTVYLKPHSSSQTIHFNLGEIRTCVAMLDKIIDTILATKERSKYDALSSRSVTLLQSIVPLMMKDPSQYERRAVARILELTACNQKGIDVISAHLH